MERRYSRGVAFQFFYVLTNAMRVGGDAENDPALASASAYLPGSVPEDPAARNRFLNYQRDTAIPKHAVRWNWIVDLPLGKRKPIGGGAGRLLDAVIGGWQLAGSGRLVSRYWALPTANWGTLGKVETYGKQYPIEDCRSGACISGYLFYNGYIPANRVNSTGANGGPNGVMGVPSNYVPSSRPIFPTPATPIPNDPNAAYYETNAVWVRLKNGTLQRTNLDNGLHPWRNQYMLGPMLWSMDASLFKRVAITDRVGVRFNADFFNVLNMPGTNMPNSATGIIAMNTSAQAARVLQLTLRLSW